MALNPPLTDKMFRNNLIAFSQFVIQTIICTCAPMNVHLLVHICAPSSEKHALSLAEEYHQSNMAVTFCTIFRDKIYV